MLVDGPLQAYSGNSTEKANLDQSTSCQEHVLTPSRNIPSLNYTQMGQNLYPTNHTTSLAFGVETTAPTTTPTTTAENAKVKASDVKDSILGAKDKADIRLRRSKLLPRTRRTRTVCALLFIASIVLIILLSLFQARRSASSETTTTLRVEH